MTIVQGSGRPVLMWGEGEIMAGNDEENYWKCSFLDDNRPLAKLWREIL